jgi:hypothetical protein
MRNVIFFILFVFLLFVNIGCVSKKSFHSPTIDIPAIPQNRTVKEEAERSLEKIKIMISENQKILDNLTFEDYLKVEENRNFSNDSDKLSYRNQFISQLNTKYKIKIP